MAGTGKQRIIEGALKLLRAEGGGAITLETTARQVGMTKPGLMYHFPTREALMLAVVDHVAARWEHLMLERLGEPLETAPASRRIRAYVEVALAAQFDRADFAIFFDAVYRDALTTAWVRRLAPWLHLPDDLPTAVRGRLTAARLIADGYWVAAATDVFAPAENDFASLASIVEDLLKDEAG
jgi:AcrR family transcriptional regulator